jgi:transcriptional regulator with XRE-family HTH domain
MSFRNKLLYAIKENNITITELSNRSGLSNTQLMNYIHHNSLPTVPSLCKIADVLQISVDYLIRDNIVFNDYNENELLEIFRALNEDRKNIAIGYLAKLYSTQN